MEVPRLLRIALFANRFDNEPRAVEVTWEELARRLQKRRERSEKDGELWSPTEYAPGARRAKENVVAVCCLVFDFDHVAPSREWLERWKGYAYVLHSSYSHTPDDPRWRVVFPLARPVPGEEWAAVWEKLSHYLADGQADAQCRDASRMYYLPACPPGAEHFAVENAGSALDPDAFPEVSRPAPEAVPERPPAVADGDRVSSDYLVGRALSEIVRSPHPRHGHGRHAGCLWLAVQLNDNGFTESEAIRIIRNDYMPYLPWTNTAGKPEAFEPVEMLDIVRWAYSKPPREPLKFTRRDPDTAEAPPPEDPPEPSQPERPHEPELPPTVVPPAESGKRWRVFTFRELAAMGLEEPAFPVAGLLREGVNLFMGKTGDGKTWWSTDIAMAISSGGKALGHRDVIQGDVLYLAFEESRAEMFQRMLQVRDERHDFPNLYIASASDEDWPLAHPRETLDAIEEWLGRHPNARLVVIDPVLAYLATSAASQAIVQADYNLLRDIRVRARRHPGVAFLVHDHRSKAAIGNGRDPQDTGVHSTGMIAAADNRLTLVKVEGWTFKLYVKGRMVPPAELTHRFDPSIGSWEVCDDEPPVRSSEVGNRIIHRLALSPDPIHYRELAERVGAPLGTVKARLFRLERAGEVKRAGDGYYRITDKSC